MTEINELIKSEDWKKEKHVPVIEVCPEEPKKGDIVDVLVSVGKEVSHPNSTEHHIRWISVFFLPEGEKTPIQIGDVMFESHGSSTEGPDTSTVYTHHAGVLKFKTDKSGKIMATSYCNIHGLWQNSVDLTVK